MILTDFIKIVFSWKDLQDLGLIIRFVYLTTEKMESSQHADGDKLVKTLSRRRFTIITGVHFLHFQIILYSAKIKRERRVHFYCDKNHHYYIIYCC